MTDLCDARVSGVGLVACWAGQDIEAQGEGGLQNLPGPLERVQRGPAIPVAVLQGRRRRRGDKLCMTQHSIKVLAGRQELDDTKRKEMCFADDGHPVGSLAVTGAQDHRHELLQHWTCLTKVLAMSVCCGVVTGLLAIQL